MLGMRSRSVKALVLLVASYVVLYVLYATQSFLPKWDGYGSQILSGHALTGYLFVDPLSWLIPLIGFVFMWLSISWYLNHFKDDQVLSVLFALAFVIGSYFAFFVALFVLYWNNAFLATMAQGSANAGFGSLGLTWSFVTTNFIDQLLASPFFLFILSALLGWVSYLIVHNYWGEKHGHVSPDFPATPST